MKTGFTALSLILFFFLFPIQCFCQEIPDVGEPWEDFSEQVQFQEAEDVNISYYDRLLAFWSKYLEAQDLRITYHPELLNYNVKLRHKAWKAGLSRVRHDEDSWQSFSLGAESVDPGRFSFWLMNYRPAFGSGLVCSSAGQGKALELNITGDADTYYPLGVAYSATIQGIQTGAFFSRQGRNYSQAPGQTGRLSRTKNPSLNSTGETLAGFSLAYQSSSLTLGALIYRQYYDAEEEFPVLSALSLAAKWKTPHHRIDLESAFERQGFAHKGVWRFNQSGLSSELGFSHSRDYIRPAYAGTTHKFRSGSDITEFWETLQYPLIPGLRLKLQAGALKDSRELSESKYLSQYLVHLAWADSLSRAGFGLRTLHRELISWADSSYLSTRPHHIRLEASLQRQLNQSLEASLLVRYHVEELSAYEKNSHYWRMTLAYKPGSWGCEASLLSWQTVRELYYWDQGIDNGFSPLGMSSSDELLMQMALFWHYHSTTLRLRVKSSLLHGSLEELSLSLSI